MMNLLPLSLIMPSSATSPKPDNHNALNCFGFFWPFLALLIVQLEDGDRKHGNSRGVTRSKGTHVPLQSLGTWVARATDRAKWLVDNCFLNVRLLSWFCVKTIFRKIITVHLWIIHTTHSYGLNFPWPLYYAAYFQSKADGKLWALCFYRHCCCWANCLLPPQPWMRPPRGQSQCHQAHLYLWLCH